MNVINHRLVPQVLPYGLPKFKFWIYICVIYSIIGGFVMVNRELVWNTDLPEKIGISQGFHSPVHLPTTFGLGVGYTWCLLKIWHNIFLIKNCFFSVMLFDKVQSHYKTHQRLGVWQTACPGRNISPPLSPTCNMTAMGSYLMIKC